MPEIMDHLNRHGERAKLQFTGHSLGGSLSLLVSLMLLNRGIVKPSTLRPVVTFGSPFVFCGGQKLLNYLGLDENHVHCVMMHRDIVPRAFSCSYPNHVALVLKRLSGTFRSHPCLNKNVSVIFGVDEKNPLFYFHTCKFSHYPLLHRGAYAETIVFSTGQTFHSPTWWKVISFTPSTSSRECSICSWQNEMWLFHKRTEVLPQLATPTGYFKWSYSLWFRWYNPERPWLQQLLEGCAWSSETTFKDGPYKDGLL